MIGYAHEILSLFLKSNLNVDRTAFLARFTLTYIYLYYAYCYCYCFYVHKSGLPLMLSSPPPLHSHYDSSTLKEFWNSLKNTRAGWQRYLRTYIQHMHTSTYLQDREPILLKNSLPQKRVDLLFTPCYKFGKCQLERHGTFINISRNVAYFEEFEKWKGQNFQSSRYFETSRNPDLD